MLQGLVYRSSESNVVLLVFRSGRIVLTGGRDIYCLNAAWRRMQPQLARYVVDTPAVERRIENDVAAPGDSCMRKVSRSGIRFSDRRVEKDIALRAAASSEFAGQSAKVYVAGGMCRDESRRSSAITIGRVDGDISAKRARVRRGGSGCRIITTDAREAPTEPPHERGP